MSPSGQFIAPSQVHLYDGTAPREVNLETLAAFLREQLRTAALDTRTDFLGYWLPKDEPAQETAFATARALAEAKVRDPARQTGDLSPLPGEIEFERRFLTAGGKKPPGILYNGYRLCATYSELIAPGEARMEHCHIVLTNQLLGTWDDSQRCHVRAAVYGFPSVISTSGLVEGPAKPREYYIARRLAMRRAPLEEAPNERYLTHGDPRLHEALKGYLLQALFFHITANPFCDSRDCRLFNAHWQEDLLHAQLRQEAGLCDSHRHVLENLSCA